MFHLISIADVNMDNPDTVQKVLDGFLRFKETEGERNMREMKSHHSDIINAVKAIKQPDINITVPEIKIPEIVVPQAQIIVQERPIKDIVVSGFSNFAEGLFKKLNDIIEKKIDLNGITVDNPVPVQLVHEGKFYKAIDKILGMTSSSNTVNIKNKNEAQINPATEENQTNGTQRTIHVDGNNNEIVQTITAFGDNRVAELHPQIQQSFEYTVSNTDLNENIVTGSATVTQVTAMAKVSTGTTTGSKGRLKGVHHCKYRAGLGGLARFSGMFTTPVAGTKQYIGIMDEAGVSADFLNGFAIGYRGTTMTMARWQNDVLFEVVRSAWDDPLDGTGSSGINIDFIKFNPFDIQFQYLGAGPIKFFVENPNTGVPYCFHIIKYGNANVTPSTYNPNYHFQMYVDNVATTSNLSVYCGSYGFFIEGKTAFIELHQPQFSSQNRQKTAVTTEVAIFTIRNKSTYAGKVNYIDITPKRFSTSIEAGAANNLGNIRMVKNATLGGTPSWTDINTTNSVVDIDTAGTTVTGGTQLIGTFLAGKNDKHFEALSDYDIILHPGETLTFAGSSAASATINAVCFWKELV